MIRTAERRRLPLRNTLRLLHWTLAACLIGGLLASAPALNAQDAVQRKGFSIRITEPENQGIVFGRTKISAEVEIASPDLVDRVEFIVGDETIFIDREPPYETYFDFGEESRSWVIRAVAHHIEEITVSDAVISRKLPFMDVSSVNRVLLWVTATDKQGNVVTDLKKEDFEVFEDGEAVEVLDFIREERPINMGIILDTSGSMTERLPAVHDAAGEFVETIRPIDRAMVIDFDDNVFLIQDLTDDREALRESIRSTEPLGGTAIYDAMHAAYRKIGTFDGRKAFLLLSDGEDTSSFFSYQRVLEEAKANNAIIYGIGVGDSLGTSKRILRELSDTTGGRAFFVKPSKLGEAYRRIADELGNQYFLAYSTKIKKFDGRWVKLRVESKRPGIDVRARRGYFAVRSN